MAGSLIDPKSRWLEEPSGDDDHRRIVTGAVLVTPDIDITSESVIKLLQTIVTKRGKRNATMVNGVVM